ncbi:MAG: ATP-binding domain-containing protein, partial [SAR324 cluster bacterium]|nr:ATP-binding domain-containing protein [SAR324 cluster bacterium]
LVAVSFDEREVIYERKELDAIALGYAITVHKSQGSEYPAVVLSLTTQHAIMLQRNLLYTAITRARRLLVLLGTEKAVRMALNNVRPEMRHTRLRQRLTMEGEASLHQAAP